MLSSHFGKPPEMALVVGTRPEMIKMARVLDQFKQQDVECCFVLTGQHYDYELSRSFVRELSLPEPSSCFQLENSTPASQIGEIMTKLEPILRNARTRVLLIQGDTNSMLAAALTGVKLGVQVAHVEAGLRSHDWRMPEEHNRRMVDHISDLLFAPTEASKHNLIDEHVYGEVFVTGNTVIDAVSHYVPLAQKSSDILEQVPFQDFCFVTLHRKENVDSADILKELVDALLDLEMPAVFPVHPRTDLRLREFGLYHRLASSSRICLLPPVGYFDSLVLMRECQFIMTDSGGLQEEATAPLIRKPVIVLRSSTERPEAVEAGFARLGGVTKNTILGAVQEIRRNPVTLPGQSPFGDGRAAERIVRTVIEKFG
jgi:UDP-N-acetylglucosamine 2-epimerase (non-hydrolysing)